MNHTEKENAILRTLKKSTMPMTLEEIYNQVGMFKTELRYLLNELYANGLVDWHGKNYRYADKLRKAQQIAEAA